MAGRRWLFCARFLVVDRDVLERILGKVFFTYRLKDIENTAQVQEKLDCDEKGIESAVRELDTNTVKIRQLVQF